MFENNNTKSNEIYFRVFKITVKNKPNGERKSFHRNYLS